MFRGLSSIIYKETIHVVRDPRTLFFMLLIPGLQLTIFGYAIDLQVRDVHTVVYNLDGRAKSRDLLDAFAHSHYFKFTGVVGSDRDLQQAIVRGEAKVTRPARRRRRGRTHCDCGESGRTGVAAGVDHGGRLPSGLRSVEEDRRGLSVV